ncbi:hypothetical protein GLAREA_10670 [Glarea lozoyensis ATCC 20868]|uniref:Uncharacterized protein n=1 Tax=Glarea lozoyensis (strain ATCC 20868 / MF5171) TaxID=1116229 RepID=S3DB54_GLAL2|nr:uncharacterized protein GLAREA_10670 [Glarea lozoyensis ATCC 20868]EPE34975.1 hypothetical protein GLAREA_10670 [Glarea lozoyensis ATCC 20868]
MASSSCPPIQSFVNDKSFDVCAFPNLKTNTPVKMALSTCCTAANTFESEDGCFVYCGVETASDAVYLSNCLVDKLGISIFLNEGYLQDPQIFNGTATTTRTGKPTGKIATTWPWPSEAVTATLSEQGRGAVTTVTFDSSYWSEASSAYISVLSEYDNSDFEASTTGSIPILTGTGPVNTGVSSTGTPNTAAPQSTATSALTGSFASTGTSAAAPSSTASGATMSKSRASFGALAVVGLLFLVALV